MRSALHLARRELSAYLTGLSGYVIGAAYLALNGVLFNTLALGGEELPSAALSQFFYFASGTTVCVSVFISMRLFAEERQAGTLDLLFLARVSTWQLVLGKFISAFTFLALLTLLTAVMPVLVVVHGGAPWGQVAVGQLGLLLLASASVAVGVLGAALARTQVVAAIVSGFLLAALTACWRLSNVTESPLSGFFASAALYHRHFAGFRRGVLQSSDVVYYGVVTYVALFCAVCALGSRRWR